LTIGENARVKGEVKTKGVVVLGKVEGNMTVKERCDLRANAQIIGDIKAGTLAIEEGATFVGQSSVGAAATAAGSGQGAKPGDRPAQQSGGGQDRQPSSGQERQLGGSSGAAPVGSEQQRKAGAPA
jgi:serine acetyltransferase